MDEDCYPFVMTMSTSITSSSRHNSNISSHRLHQQHNSSQSQQKQQQQQIQTQHIHTSAQSVCSSSSTNDNSSISSSDIDVDDSNVKDEPLSPSSSCPPSPSSSSASYGGGNVNLANMAAYTNTDLVFEHKVSKFLNQNKYLYSIYLYLEHNINAHSTLLFPQNGSLQLSPASQSLLKNQHIVIGSSPQAQPQNAQQRIGMSKLNIKMEPQISSKHIYKYSRYTLTNCIKLSLCSQHLAYRQRLRPHCPAMIPRVTKVRSIISHRCHHLPLEHRPARHPPAAHRPCKVTAAAVAIALPAVATLAQALASPFIHR